MQFDIRDTRPAVSVLVITYNHASYIRQCLDSLLMQETDFPYEICIGEDESSDGTREICIEYAERFPEKINLLLHSQSEDGRKEYYAQGNYNYVKTLEACRGKYIADCDGDDFWCDPKKLQKQYDIMEADSSVNLVHSDYGIVDKHSHQLINAVGVSQGLCHRVKEDSRAFLFDVLTDVYHIRTVTVMMRSSALLQAISVCLDDLKKIPMADVPMWCEVLRHGRAVYIDEPLACYRRLKESACNSEDPVIKTRFVNRASDWCLLLSQRYDLPANCLWANKIKNCNRFAIVSGNYDEIDHLHETRNCEFPPFEHVIYHAGRMPLLRWGLKLLYVRKYHKHQRAVQNPRF